MSTTAVANNCKKIVININTTINNSQDFEIIFNKLNIIALNNNDSINKTDYIYSKTINSFLYYDFSQNTNIRVTDNTNIIRVIGKSIVSNTTSTGLLCKINCYVPLDTTDTEYIINILYQMLVNYNTYSLSGTTKRYTQSYNLTLNKSTETNMYMDFKNYVNLFNYINWVDNNFTKADYKNYLLIRSTSNEYTADTKNLIKVINTLPYYVEYNNNTTLNKYTIKINNIPYTQPTLALPYSNALKSLYMYNP
jgi:hypothetical protein